MTRLLVLALYNILLPVVFLLAFPGWVIKMRKRGGLGTGLWQRLGKYDKASASERKGGVYVHAVSVGEVMIALKLIDKWLELHPEDHFVLVPTTATGHAVAKKRESDSIRVIYSPVDFGFVNRKVLARFEPSQLVLIEAEMWPNMLNICRKRSIPVSVANVRLSDRSERRYGKFKFMVRPVFRMVSKFLVQEYEDIQRWQGLGVEPEKIVKTGSVKFDPSGGVQPQKREEFSAMLDSLGAGKKVVMCLSTFPGEEQLIARQLNSLENILLVVVPRHVERRSEVCEDLRQVGYRPVLRSTMKVDPGREPVCFVIDSTGELRDWTAHANLAIVGKSWLAKGGQNPAEAVAAKVPVVSGMRMDNFEPLVSTLVAAGGYIKLDNPDLLVSVVEELLTNDRKRDQMVESALQVLQAHDGAVLRTIELLRF